jgi:ribosomal 50S subunit-recycling heat shock protein
MSDDRSVLQGVILRIDKWLSSVNVIKRRTIATDMVKSGVVFINDIEAKPSKNVSIGDKIRIKYLKEEKSYQVLNIPTTKTIPKSQKEFYVKEL